MLERERELRSSRVVAAIDGFAPSRMNGLGLDIAEVKPVHSPHSSSFSASVKSPDFFLASCFFARMSSSAVASSTILIASSQRRSGCLVRIARTFCLRLLGTLIVPSSIVTVLRWDDAIRIVLEATALEDVRAKKQEAKKKSGDFTDAENDEEGGE